MLEFFDHDGEACIDKKNWKDDLWFILKFGFNFAQDAVIFVGSTFN